MKDVIYSITEAYSMQPETLSVGSNVNTWKGGKRVIGPLIVEIKLIGEEYEGFDDLGQRLFSYRYNSVNVHYSVD